VSQIIKLEMIEIIRAFRHDGQGQALPLQSSRGLEVLKDACLLH